MSFLNYALPDSLKGEISDLASLIEAFRSNAISETELKAHRVPFGVYEQRRRGTYMVRARCAAGIITPAQLKRVAELSLKFASGTLHVTTRQEIQIHDVAMNDLIPVIRELAAVGLSTRGGGGNTVRNITAPWDSGVAAGEVFDVAPYAVGLTSAMTAKSDSWLLPRKYKIAFSNSGRDTTGATVNDLGFIARIRDGVKGFRVFVAGGMGRLSQPGNLLHDFVPADEIFLIAEAIKQLFTKHGNRRNKHAARLRFLWNSLGRRQFIEFYEEEKARLRNEGIGSLEIHAIANEPAFPAMVNMETNSSAGFDVWKRRYTGRQTPEAHTIAIPLLFGLISAGKAMKLADFLTPFGENTIRFTHNQNIALRNIPSEYLANVYHRVRTITDLADSPALFGNAVACAGASTCQLGICRSRGAIEAIIDCLKTSPVDLDGIAALRIHLSGCSNTCGQHMLSDIGFFGKVGRKDQHSFPAYAIVAGATIDTEGNTRLAEKVDEINARDLPVFVENFLIHYGERKSHYPTFADYLDTEGRAVISQLANRYREIPSFDIDRSYYRDWGDTDLFSLAGKGTGECSAGLFDLIEIDLLHLRKLRTAIMDKAPEVSSAKALYDLALVSSRMLLITRGVEAVSESDVFDLFEKRFIGEKLIDSHFLYVTEKCRAGESDGIVPLREDVLALSDAVERLYQGMDNSLQFKIPADKMTAPSADVAVPNDTRADLIRDFRGVRCPMNFVKTKMALAKMKPGEILEILLDDGAPIENVPRSLEAEGHHIARQKRNGSYWIVTVQKG